MSKQRESKLSGKIMAALRVEGYFCFKAHGSEMMMSGLPDIIVCAQGFFLGLETKLPEGGQAKPIQRLRIQQILDAGGHAQVVRGVDEALRVVAEWVEFMTTKDGH